MKTKIEIATKITKGLVKISLVVTLCLFLLFFLFAGAVQVPFIQNFLVKKATEYGTEITGYKITIEGIHIDWLDVIVLEETVLWDNHKQKMIYLGEAEVDYTILSLMKGSLYLDNITLRDGEVNLVRYQNESSINISEFIWKIQELTTPKVKRVGPPVPIEIPQFTLDNMLFSYNDNREPFMKEDYFDHNHFTLDSIHGRVTDLYAVLDTIRLTTHHLRVSLRESHLKIKELNTDFLLDKHQIECSNLFVEVGETILSNYFQFYYKDINDLSDFNEKTDITIRLKQSEVAVRDIAHFAPSLKGINDHIVISGNMKGRINRFRIDSLVTYFGKSGHIAGKMRFDGLPNISETFMDIKLTHINTSPNDLIQYIGPSSKNILNKLGDLQGKGSFIGLVNDFTVTGDFKTDLGQLSSDVNLKIDDKNKSANSSYKGTLSTNQFNLGKLLDNTIVQTITMSGEIEGKGFTINDAALKLAADITQLGLNGYDYKNIKTEATFAKRFFDGEITVNDSNIVLNAIGKIDMKTSPEEFKIHGTVKNAKLEKLNLTDLLSNLSTEFVLDFKGTDIDSIIGSAKLSNTKISSGDKNIQVNNLYLALDKVNHINSINFNSDLLELTMNGTFVTTELISDVTNLYKEFLLFYDQDKKQMEQYYASKPKTNHARSKSDFTINLKNINNIIDLFYPGIYIAQQTKITGEYASGSSTRLNAFTTIDSLFVNGNELYQNTIDFSLSKLIDSADVLASVYTTSKLQKFKNEFKTSDFMFEGQWSQDIINFSTTIAQPDKNDRLSLQGDITIKEKTKRVTFKNSHIDILDEIWTIKDSTNIDFNKDGLVFNFFKLNNGDQSIVIQGDFSSDEKKHASIFINSFQLKNLNPLFSYKMDGTLNGHLKIRDIYKNLDLTGGASIKKFTLDEFPFGDINGTVDWSASEEQLNVNVDVIREHFKAINITGNIKPPKDKKKEEVNLIANFNSADLGFISPILKGVMSDISGFVNGSLKITGSFDNLRLRGDAAIDDGKFKIDYLGTTYSFTDKIYFTEDQIKFKNMILTDLNGNKGKINGGIAHDGFKNFLVDVKGDFKRFNVLRTTEKDNSLFYGITNATGDFTIFGPFEDLTIKVHAKSEKDTKVYIPLTGGSEVSQKEFIKFVPAEDTTNLVKADTADNFRLRVYLNMEITPDAYTEIIFDKRAGDIIRGRGEGNIELNIDTKGDMTMFGNYSFVEGRYNFTMAGIINKAFIIDKGSRMTWNGDPYEGTLDIRAKYNQSVSLKPLFSFDSSLTSKSDLQRSYPTDVVLSVKGNLSAPQISMDIDILRYPTDPQLSTVVTDFESKIKTNEYELNRQVFSLIMLRSFTAPNSFSGVSSVGNSTVSELFSSQLSHFLSQVDQNLEVNVNLKNMDKDALNTFNLRLSYTALDGKLRISRDGNFQNAQNSSQANISNIAGEWTVEYMLSKDGNLRIKLFNRINNNALVSSTGNVNTSAGASIMHVQGFNNLSDIFGKRKRKEEAEKLKRQQELILKEEEFKEELIEEIQEELTAPNTEPILDNGGIPNSD